MSNFVQQGIEALQNGDRAQARNLFGAAVRENPQDVSLWLWLSRAVDSDQEQAMCFQRVLRLDPNNQEAASGLARLVARGSVSFQTGSAPLPGNGIPNQQSLARAPSGSAPVPAAVSRPSSNVVESEGVIFEAHPSLIPWFIALFGLVFVFACAIVGFFQLFPGNDQGVVVARGIFLLFVALAVLRLGFTLIVNLFQRLFARYTMTTQHLVLQLGIFSRSRKTIPINRIQDVAYHQNLLERPFGIGDVVVESAGEKGQVRLLDLPACQQRTEEILRVIQRRG